MHRVGALILAAGASSRLGVPKQFLLFQGETFLRRTAKAAIAARCEPIVVVAGDAVDRVRAELSELPVQVAVNESWQRGLGTSIKSGLAHLRSAAPNLHAVIILACDQPFVSSGTIRKLIATESPIAASGYADTVGIPALFDSRYFAALMSLPDDSGAKRLIELNRTDLKLISFPEGAIDIDTEADYVTLGSITNDHASNTSATI